MNRKWLVNRTNPEYIKYISKSLSISPVLAQILINRGVKTPQEIYDFLNPSISNLSDPFELTGLKSAVERIKEAFRRGERVLVHGDYDADGLSATAIMVYALKELGLDVHYFIPNRITHGYGFNLDGVKKAKELGAKLVITVDCGITSFEAVSYARSQNIDVVITDHHEPVRQNTEHRVQNTANGITTRGHGATEQRSNGATETLSLRHCVTASPLRPSYSGFCALGSEFLVPDAVAIINPKLSTTDSRLLTLSGAGVAFKVAQALDSSPVTLGQSKSHSSLLLDLAAIGTMADIVPLIGENRIIVREGLKLIQDGLRPGIRALKNIAGLEDRDFKAGLLSFTLIPRINAAGRISDATDVVRLLLSDSGEETMGIATALDRMNSERQMIEEDVYQEALAKLNAKGFDSAIVLSGEGWHHGVIGIVASRIAEEFYRPTFIFSVEDGIAKGSARSIPAFDICNGLIGCREFLIGFGGHKQAAGLKLKVENIDSFEGRIQDVVRNSLSENDFAPSLKIDADVALAEVNFALLNELSILDPFGYGNSEPLLGAKKLEVVNPRIVGNNHLKMRLRQRSQLVDAIGFDMGRFFDRLEVSTTVDAVFTPTVNEWERGRYLQLSLKAFRPSI